MSISEKLTIIAENQQKVYDAGKKKQYDEFWDNVWKKFDSSKTNQHLFAGVSWNDNTFYPNRNITFYAGRGDCIFLLNQVSNIKQRLIECGITMDTSQITNFLQMFTYARTEELPEISTISSTVLTQIFSECKILKSVDKLILKNDGSQSFSSSFNNCISLENIVIEGVIGKSISFQHSPLSTASIVSIIEHLSDSVTGQTLTLNKSAVNTAFGIDVDDESTFPEGSEYYNLRHSKDKWTFTYA